MYILYNTYTIYIAYSIGLTLPVTRRLLIVLVIRDPSRSYDKIQDILEKSTRFVGYSPSSNLNNICYLLPSVKSIME